MRDAARIANQHYKALHDASATVDLSTEDGREALRLANLLRHATQSWPFALVGQHDDFVSQWAKAMSYNFVGSHMEADRQAEAHEVKLRALDRLAAALRPH